MRPWLAAIIISLALSGCADDGVQEIDSSPDGAAEGNVTAEPTPPSPGNATQEPAVNLPPVVNLTADVQNGTGPLAVNLTIDASDNGDTLTWTLSVNGTEIATGTSVPATVEHTFETGDWNVMASVSDGEHAVEAYLTITAMAAGPEPVYEEYECTSDIGLVLVSGSAAGNNLGGCPVTGDIDGPRLVHEVSPEDGCDIQYDTDGDDQADGTAAVGQRHEAGTSFTAFCEPGTADSVNRLVLEVVE